MSNAKDMNRINTNDDVFVNLHATTDVFIEIDSIVVSTRKKNSSNHQLLSFLNPFFLHSALFDTPLLFGIDPKLETSEGCWLSTYDWRLKLYHLHPRIKSFRMELVNNWN